MNTPNKFTLLRAFLVPFFILFLFWNALPLNFLWALVIFIAASITDALDGYLARKHDLVTTFGKFLDPIADKILVVSALISFVELDFCSAVAVIIIIAREFIVTSVRLAAADSGKVIAAAFSGKLKTAFTMIAICAVLIMQILVSASLLDSVFAKTAGEVLIWIAAALTVFSGIEYIVKNRECINTTK